MTLGTRMMSTGLGIGMNEEGSCKIIFDRTGISWA